MPSGASQQSSIAVPVVLIVFAVVVTITVVLQQRTIGKLDKTDAIACAFIQADATTRLKQASNATKASSAQRLYLRRLARVIALFEKPTKSQTAAQRAASATFKGYLVQEMTVWESTSTNQAKNIALTRALAAKANRLSTRLACSTP